MARMAQRVHWTLGVYFIEISTHTYTHTHLFPIDSVHVPGKSRILQKKWVYVYEVSTFFGEEGGAGCMLQNLAISFAET